MALPKWLRVVLNLPDKEPKQATPTSSPNPYLANRTSSDTPWTLEERRRNPFLVMVRTLLTIVLVLLLITGLRSWFRPNQTNTGPVQLPAGAKYPEPAASGLALRFAEAYLSWDAKKPEARATALEEAGWAGNPSLGWNGKGKAQLSNPTIAAVDAEDDDLGSVTVTGKWTTWDAKNRPSSRLVGLRVPISVIDNHVVVTGAPALVAPPGAMPPPNAKAEPGDSALTEETKRDAKDFFTSYGANSDISVITAPGSTLEGLGGVVKFTALTTWRVAPVDPATPNETSAHASVTWQTASGGTVQQDYDLLLIKAVAGDVSRWQVMSLT